MVNPPRGSDGDDDADDENGMRDHLVAFRCGFGVFENDSEIDYNELEEKRVANPMKGESMWLR